MNIVPLHRLHVDRPHLAWQAMYELHDVLTLPCERFQVALPDSTFCLARLVDSDVVRDRRRYIYDTGWMKIVIWLV